MDSTIFKIQSKPVIKEAMQLTKNNCFDVKHFVGEKGKLLYSRWEKGVEIRVFHSEESWEHVYMDVETLEGTMRANEKDWIIKGVNGEYYPCKPDVFEKTYDIIKKL